MGSEVAAQRYAVVTGANKGIGCGVANPASVVTLAEFVKSQFGKLDILVNNAGISGTVINDKDLATLLIANPAALSEEQTNKAVTQTFELAEECLQINYYGTKITTESLLPLLKLSDSPRIVNVSSSLGKLAGILNEEAKTILSDADNLTEEKVDVVLKKFLEDFKEGSLESKGWPKTGGAYGLSKAAINAYTRIVAKSFPTISVNSICPGYVITDITGNTGFLTAEEGAASIVTLVLLPNGSPSGQIYNRTEVASF
ncbi:(+)-neomenthol dehydrogenase [Trifolium repens]|nr:(+)-neomenthol dehydrogenase [Trifolium repens]